jgi:uncharacterized protein YggE
MLPSRHLLLTLVLVIPTIATAQSDPNLCQTSPIQCATLIETQATSRARIPNTVVDISLRISVSEKDLATTQRELSEKSTALLSYLRSKQVQRLSTEGVSFRPDTRSSKNGPDRTVAYDGLTTISFRILPDQAPAILSEALDQGATSISSTTFTPTEEEISTARRSLEADATRTAIAKATNIAQAAGLRVLAVRNIAANPDGQAILATSRGMLQNDFKDAYLGGLAPQIQTESGAAALSITVSVIVAAHQ